MPKSMDLGDFSIVKLHNAIFSLIRRNFPIMLKFQYRKEAAQDELIAQLTEEIQTFKETLRVVRENQQLEKELDK